MVSFYWLLVIKPQILTQSDNLAKHFHLIDFYKLGFKHLRIYQKKVFKEKKKQKTKKKVGMRVPSHFQDEKEQRSKIQYNTVNSPILNCVNCQTTCGMTSII